MKIISQKYFVPKNHVPKSVIKSVIIKNPVIFPFFLKGSDKMGIDLLFIRLYHCVGQNMTYTEIIDIIEPNNPLKLP